jgi:hypothetical protein
MSDRVPDLAVSITLSFGNDFLVVSNAIRVILIATLSYSLPSLTYDFSR